jgi:hypothetical protein
MNPGTSGGQELLLRIGRCYLFPAISRYTLCAMRFSDSMTQQLYDPIDAFVSNTSRHVVHRFSDASSR